MVQSTAQSGTGAHKKMPTPLANFSAATDAYTRAYRGATESEDTGRSSSLGAGEPGDFADLVKGALKEAEIIGKRAEALSVAGVTDRADLNQVVGAVAEAEVTLQTVVAVRDKVIESYKEILRMPM